MSEPVSKSRPSSTSSIIATTESFTELVLKEKEHVPVPKTTESMASMVTVRLSDTDLESLPSSNPTLKLVNDNAEEYSLKDEPMYASERTESPVPEDMASRRASTDSLSSQSGPDWEGLERTEGEHINDETSQEVGNSLVISRATALSPVKISEHNSSDATPVRNQGTAFLLARLEQENNRIAKDPKALLIHPERPPSLAQLKRMMDKPDPQTLRYSMLPTPPPLTDLDFYAALVADYKRAALKLPHLLSKKIHEGVPPPLRGVVWIAMSGARDSNLEGLYDQLLGETSPYEHLIGKDIGRTGLEMFRQEGGEGQRMLGRVLRAFSIYDTQIGYCQGFVRFSPRAPPVSNYCSLGFLVGPLLMHMGEKEAFCVLVRFVISRSKFNETAY